MSKVMRSLSCVILSAVMLLSMNVWMAAAVSAEETVVQPRFSYTNMVVTALDITTNGTAYCSASVEGYDGITTKVEIQMVLQKSIKRRWTDMVTWEGTFNDVIGFLDEQTTVTTGTYRVKAVYTVYSGSAYEEITGYSQEKYILVSAP